MSRTPRILILNYEYPPIGGGAANALSYLLTEFGLIGGVEIDLVTSSHEGKESISSVANGISVHKLAIKKDSLHYWTEREILGYWSLATRYTNKLLAKEKYDLCHAFFALPCGAMAYRLRSRLPYIVALRGSDVPVVNKRFKWMNSFIKPVFKRVLKASSGVWANSEGLRQLAKKTTPDIDIKIIHNGVDCREFVPAQNRRPEKRYRLVCVSRLIGRKGIDDLITALPKIKAKLGKVELTLVGEGNLKEELQALAESQGVSDDIRWLGYVDHSSLPEIYVQADLFVLPSYFEGMSNALLEAMASGLPVVVTNTGGTGELVDENGLVIEAGDQAGIIEAATLILSEEERWVRYSQRSREIALKFSWENAAQEYLNAYERAIDGSQ